MDGRDQRAGRGRAERVAVGVVTHRVLLGVVPQAGDGVAVVVVHYQARLADIRSSAVLTVGELDEFIHQTAVEGLLLGGVLVIHVAGEGLGGVEPGRVEEIGVVREQVSRESVYRRRAG